MRTNLTKVLGISLLAIVGILAVNVSAAHATLSWQLLLSGANAPNNLLNLKAALPEGELLVPGLGLKIKCTGGSATTHLVGGATLEGTANAAFTGCFVLDFPKCEVHGAGDPVGTISAEGKGLGKLGTVANSIEALVSAAEGEPFTEIIIENPLCAFNETEAEVTGGATLVLLEALTNLLKHLCHFNDDNLFFGEQASTIDGPGGSDTILFDVVEALDRTWAIHHIE
jgi:hypothetical protein